MTDKQVNAIALLLILAPSAAVIGVGSIVNRVVDKRNKKRETQEELSRKVAHAHYMETIEAIYDDLDRTFKKAQKALLDDDFNQIIEDF